MWNRCKFHYQKSALACSSSSVSKGTADSTAWGVGMGQGLRLTVVAHAFNPSTREAEEVRGQPSLQSEFQDSQSYIEKPCFEKPKKKKKKKKKEKRKTILYAMPSN
jgi:hypothetical protein